MSQFLVDLKKARNTKHKKAILDKLLLDRGIQYQVEYRRNYARSPGWYILDGTGQLLGYNFYAAKSLIESGTLDFISKLETWKQDTPQDQLVAISSRAEGDLLNFEEGIISRKVYCRRAAAFFDELRLLHPFLTGKKRW